MRVFKKIQQIFQPVDSAQEKVAETFISVPVSVAAEVHETVSHLALVDAKRAWMVRRREFGKLRLIRHQLENSDAPIAPIFSGTSKLLHSEERHSTLQKIDEIEAQMSMQWWKTDRLDLRNNA